jgi:hypothetical protein
MKRIGILIAAMAVMFAGQAMAAKAPAANEPPPIDKKMRDTGMAEAPAVVQAAGISCQVKDAYLINTVEDKKAKTKTSFYEVACNNGLGYVVQQAPDKAAAFDCLSINGQAADDAAAGKPGSLTCRLPDNADPKAGLTPILVSAGSGCTPANARAMGATAAGDAYYEVACSDGSGVVLQTSKAGKPTVSNCAAFLGGGTECKLTDKAKITASLATEAAKSGKPCSVSDFRYVGGTSTGSTFYEIACGATPGFMMETSAKGEYAQAIDCAKAQQVAGGCKLTDTTTAETAEIALYTKKAAASGFPCQVNKYVFIGLDKGSNSEVVELACANRPDGAVALFPVDAGGKAVILDCLQAGGLGASCKLSKPDALYAKYTGYIAAKKSGSSCKVSGARWLAQTTTKEDLIETACSDGLPGWVVQTAQTGNVSTLLTCPEAARAGAACQLPSNTKK